MWTGIPFISKEGSPGDILRMMVYKNNGGGGTSSSAVVIVQRQEEVTDRRPKSKLL